MQEINLIFGARNGEFRITTIMLNGSKTSGKFKFLKFQIRDFLLNFR